MGAHQTIQGQQPSPATATAAIYFSPSLPIREAPLLLPQNTQVILSSSSLTVNLDDTTTTTATTTTGIIVNRGQTTMAVDRKADDSTIVSVPHTAVTTTATATATATDNHNQDQDRDDTTRTTTRTNITTSTTAANNNHKRRKTARVCISNEVTYIPLLTSGSFLSTTTTTLTPNRAQVTKASLWLTKDERREILLSNQRVSRTFQRRNPSKVQKANLVFDEIVNHCCRQQDSNNNNDDDDDDDNDDDFTDEVCNSFQRERLKCRHIATASATNISNTTATTYPTTSTATTNTTSTISHHHAVTKKRKRIDDYDESTNSPFSDNITSTTTRPSKTRRSRNTIIDLPTHVRGLEWCLLPDAKRHRKTHARTILRWQERFRQMNQKKNNNRRCDHNDDDDYDLPSFSLSSSSSDYDEVCSSSNKNLTLSEQQELLGNKSNISSRRSVWLAQALANSDAKSDTITGTTTKDNDGNETPSLTGTSDSDDSSVSSNDEDDDNNDDQSNSDSSDDDDDDDDDNDDENTTTNTNIYNNNSATTFTASRPTNSYYTTIQRRNFRPRMMPPSSWGYS